MSSTPDPKRNEINDLKNRANEILPNVISDAKEGVQPSFGDLITVLRAGLFDQDIARKGDELHDALNKDET